MCGLSGAAGLKPNRHKLNTLGIWNETRGEHSAGIYTGHELFKEAGLFRDLSASIEYSEDFYKPYQRVFLQHTRHATVGARTAKNAHPFEFKNDKRTMIFMHNGSLKFYYQFKKKFDIPDYDVDSQLLGYAIFNNPNKLTSILKSYEGAAALAWTFEDEPNTLYLWKGASREYKHTEKLTEERPLFYYFDNEDECTYFSSIEDSLDLIRSNSKEKINRVPNNNILKFVDGKLVSKTRVKRVGVKYEAAKNWSSKKKDQGNGVTRVPAEGHNQYGFPIANPYQRNIPFTSKDLTKVNENVTQKPNNVIFEPTNPQNLSNGKVVWYQGLYFSNGHLLQGKQIISKDRDIVHRIADGKEYWFYKGYMLKSYMAYASLKNKALNHSQLQNSCFDILLTNSHHEAYIVKGTGQLYLNKSRVNGGKVTPLYSVYEYNVNQEARIFNENKIKTIEKTQEVLKDLLPDEEKKKKQEKEKSATINGSFENNYQNIIVSVNEATGIADEIEEYLDPNNFQKLGQLRSAQAVLKNAELAEEFEQYYADSEKSE